ncbi:MAG: PAS domain S-box protein, partial [Bacteroidota bacterium]
MSNRVPRRTSKPKTPAAAVAPPPSKQQFTSILDSLTDASFSLNDKWQFTYLSPKADFFLAKLRKKRAKLLGKNIWEEFPDTTKLPAYKLYQKAFKEQSPVHFEEYYLPLDSWFETHVFPSPNGLDVYLHDITLRKKAEAALREGEERYRLLVQYSPDAVLVHSAGKIVFVNNAAAQLMGATNSEELVGREMLSLVHPGYHKVVKEQIRKIVQDHKAIPAVEERFIRLDGSTVDVEAASIPFTYNGQQAAQLVVRDITDRKRTEAALREALQYNEQIISTAGQGIVVYDTELRYIVWNAFMERLTGMSAQEVLGKHAVDVFPHLREQGVYDLLLRTIAGETTTSGDVFFFVPQTGKSGWVMGNYVPHRDAHGTILGIIGVISDISAHKRIEEALRKSDERYRAFIAHSTEGIFRLEFRKPMPIKLPEEEQIEHIYRHLYHAECNLAMAQMYGYTSPQELIGKTAEEFLPRDIPQNVDYLRSFIRSGYRLKDAESNERDKDGKVKYFLNNVIGIIEEGLLIHVWGIRRDVTEQKRAEEALRQSELKYRSLIEQMNDGLMQVTNDDAVLFVNQQFCELVGYSPDELLGRVASDLLTDEPERAVIRAKNEMRRRGESDQYEIQLRKKTGEKIWVRISGAPMYDNSGRVVGSIGLHTDITKRKRVEEALRKSEDQLRRAQQVGKMGSWYVDIGKNTLDWSEEVYRIFGRDLATFRPTNEDFFASVHPADRETVLHTSAEAIRTGDRYEIEHRIILPGGAERYVFEQAEIAQDDNGHSVAMIGVVQDITERKRSEQALRASEKKFRGLFENVLDGVFQSTPDGVVLAANPALVRMLGYDSEQQLRSLN